jgi:hypothetical protein
MVVHGEYQFSSTSILVVTREGDKLMGLVAGQEKTEFPAENETTYFSKGENAQYIFAKNDKGIVDRLIYRSHGNDTILKKTNKRKLFPLLPKT